MSGGMLYGKPTKIMQFMPILDFRLFVFKIFGAFLLSTKMLFELLVDTNYIEIALDFYCFYENKLHWYSVL